MKAGCGVILFVSLLAAGCSTQSEDTSGLILSTMQDAQESLNDCISAAYNDPRFEPLAQHMPMNIRGVSMEQLTDDHFATDAQISLLQAYDVNARACRKAYLDELWPVAPTVASMTAAAYAKNENGLSELLQKTMSWGAYIQGVVGTYRELNPKLAAEVKRITTPANPDTPAGQP